MKRLLVYSHDTYGLGNIRRMLAICEHLCAVHADISILIVSGSPMLHAFRLSARIDYIKLPCLTRTVAGDYEVKSLGLDYEATIRMRRQILAVAVSEFEPHLIIVDKKPFGVDEELRPALETTTSSAPRPKLVLLLRDILDDPETTIRIWERNHYYEAIETYFDSVLVMGSMQVFDLPTRYRFPPAALAKVEFCGYVGRKPQAADRASTRAQIRADLQVYDDLPLVVVTAGGGADGAPLTDCYVSALDEGDAVDFVSIVICGPEMPEEARHRLRAVAARRDDVRVVEFTDDMSSFILAADVVVSMAGYNTLCEVLSVGRAAVVVPRVRPVQEQLIRAKLLAEFGMLRMVHPDDLSPDLLLTEVNRALEVGCQPRNPLDMLGLERVEKHVAGLLGDG